MQTLDELKTSAIESALSHGHKNLSQWESNSFIFSQCQRCGREIIITINPNPNEINISGEAVATNCVITPLPPIHNSPDTAFLVDDYPYGFNLRCKIRYWLEWSPKLGCRFVTQTTNPKRGHIWNKPKYSTYSRIAGAMYLDSKNHVRFAGLGEYSDTAESQQFANEFLSNLNPLMTKSLNTWLVGKTAYDNAKNSGDDMYHAGRVATVAMRKYEKDHP